MNSQAKRTAVAVATVALLLAGCATTKQTTMKTGWSDYAEILTKDYVVVGHVRVETEQIRKVSPFRLFVSVSGDDVTYDALLAEAKRLNADDVINVRVDKITEKSSSPIDFFLGSTRKVTHIANALAIKLTTPVADAIPTVTHPGSETPSGGFRFVR